MNTTIADPTCAATPLGCIGHPTSRSKSLSRRKTVPAAIVWTLGLALACGVTAAAAQTDVEADPAHHHQLFENDKVRVIRATFGPHEKAAGMFDAKEVVIVMLTNGATRLHFPGDAFADPPPSVAGTAFFAPAGRIQPENLRNERLEYIVVEPKRCK